jgi:HAD superfamily hydrolase (TIGR01509 family)
LNNQNILLILPRAKLPCRLLILDLDDTLIATREIAYRKTCAAAIRLFLPVPSKDLFFGIYGHYPFEECVGIMFGTTDIRRFKNEYDFFTDKINDACLPGVRSFLAVAEKLCLPICIVTNSSEKKAMRKIGATGYFHQYMFHADNDFAKPDARSISAVLKKYPLTPPEKIVAIGDSLNDLFPARKNGIHFVGVLTGVASREDFIANVVPEELIVENLERLTLAKGEVDNENC